MARTMLLINNNKQFKQRYLYMHNDNDGIKKKRRFGPATII